MSVRQLLGSVRHRRDEVLGRTAITAGRLAAPSTGDRQPSGPACARSGRRPAGHPRRDRRARAALAGALDGAFRRGARSVRRGARPADRHRHRQERPCRAQDRRDPGLDRHAGAVRPPRRGEPRRSRHDRRRRRDPRAVEFRRERRTRRHHRLFAPLRDPADRDHRRPRLDPRRGGRCRAAAAARRRGLPDGPGADDLDDDDDGARRRAGDRAARAQGLFDRRFPAVPSRAASSAASCCGSATSCIPATRCRWSRRTRRCPRRSW